MHIPADPRAEKLFHDALERAPEERTAFLASACAGDLALHTEVESLLAAWETAPAYLETPAIELLDRTPRPPVSSWVGKSVGGYTIQRELASGGMGVVYQAEQHHPRRHVALKILRTVSAESSLAQRFEDEARILARLRHPHIAQLYDAGVLPLEPMPLPYFALEFIPQAKSLTAHAGEKKLSVSQRLELFLKVCSAVHHGHQKGVIHRDLKPGNILVDADGTPKVIDFGIARVLDADLVPSTAHTAAGQLLGTLPYMSPEQCDAGPAEADVRSDVYALGVVLYELLCGQLPYDLNRGSLTDAARVIAHVPPVRPSQRQPAVRGDLEIILLKALEKDRDRRYAAVADLAADLQRYLRRQPIQARAPGTMYVLSRMVARHKLPTALLALLALLVAGSAVTFYGQSRRVVRERDRAEEINRFLQNMLAAANPSDVGRDATVREVLDRAARSMETEFVDRPDIEAALRLTIGNTYRALGLYDAAEPHLRQALALHRLTAGADHPDVAGAMTDLAMLCAAKGRAQEAEALYRAALDIFRRKLGENHERVAGVLTEWGLLRYEQLDYAAAEPLLRDALALARRSTEPDSLLTATALNNLALLLKVRSEFREAEQLYRESLRIRQKRLGEDHLLVAFTLNNLAGVLGRLGDLPGAAENYRRALSTLRSLLGNDHPHVATAADNLGHLLLDLHQFDEAESLLHEALTLRRRILGNEHAHVAASLLGLGRLFLETDRAVEAEPLFREAVNIRTAALPPGHWMVAYTRMLWGGCLVRLQRYDEAELLLTDAYARLKEDLGEDDRRTQRASSELRAHYEAAGQLKKAQELIQELDSGTPGPR